MRFARPGADVNALPGTGDTVYGFRVVRLDDGAEWVFDVRASSELEGQRLALRLVRESLQSNGRRVGGGT